MPNIDSNQACPCGSEMNFSKCCQPYLDGKKAPATAESLLRSRYSAFVTGNVDYILNTHHPETRGQIKREEVEDWSKNSDWRGLKIGGSDRGQAGDDDGVIEFIAEYLQNGRVVDHREKSEFRKHDGTWYFYDVYKQKPIKREVALPGRNDPCPCGSGKKYKKCCAA